MKNYFDEFRNWASGFDEIIDKGTKDSGIYQILDEEFAEKINDQNSEIDISFFEDFFESNQDISIREAVLYYVLTVISNTQVNKDINTINNWIEKADNLSSRFDFSNDHCYLFSCICSLESEIKNEKNIFKIHEKEFFSHIIQDKDLLPSDKPEDNEKKNGLIYYLFRLLVQLKKYNDAYKIYNGFIDRDVKDLDVQIDVIKTLTFMVPLTLSLEFIRKSGDENLDEKLNAMIEIALEKNNDEEILKNRLTDFLHLPFNERETEIILNSEKVDDQFCKLFLNVRK